jgi:FAD/FMN-containing dehydrogenase
LAVSSRSNDFESRRARLEATIKEGRGETVRLSKSTSNLFRNRETARAKRLDVRDFNHVLGIDEAAEQVEVEGMTPYEQLVDATLSAGFMPAVVPELKSITIGGAVSGLGIEASSFRYGLVHETVEELEVLLADGGTVIATPDNEHSDLFFGFANSFGTLGYALRLKARVVPTRPYVCLNHEKFADPERYFEALGQACERGDLDFVEGEVFGRERMALSTSRFVDDAPYTSDYSLENIYYKSILARDEDYLVTRDFIWRWDTDWFWCSRVLGAENPVVRRLLGRKRLNSVTYMRLLKWSSRHGLAQRLNRLRGFRHQEAVIQDVPIPIERAAEFLQWFHDEIGILPVWTCPVRVRNPDRVFDLFPMQPDRLYINFGFWDAIREKTERPPGYYNRKIEAKVAELGGLKSLYSDVYYPPDEFWQQFDGEAYRRLKQRYDPEGRLSDLYEKTVLRR